MMFDEDNTWYRAVCTEVAGDGMPAVRFIDFGNNQTVHVNNIRKMPAEFAYRRITIDCTLDGINEISPSMLEVLNEFFAPNKDFTVEKAETMMLDQEKTEFSLIRCEKVLDLLRKQNLLL